MTKMHNFRSEVHPQGEKKVSRKMCGIGLHAIIELYDCPYDLLNDEGYVRKALRHAADQAQAQLLKLTSHPFSPQGVTALGLLSESHISIHTWPEKGYAAADLFTCSQKTLSVAVIEALVSFFHAGRHDARYFPRGEHLLNGAGAVSYDGGQKALF